jgi:hypothetical protein
MEFATEIDLALLQTRIERLRGDASLPPDASIVIPVNAKSDLGKALETVDNICNYNGRHRLEIVLAINNFPRNDPPVEIEQYARMGLTIAALAHMQDLKPRAQYRVAFGGRILGTRAAHSDITVHVDADCRLANATRLLDWYISKLREGYKLAYTHVGYYDVRESLSIQVRLGVHHMSRWVKRHIFRIPTSRGSNYAVDHSLFLQLFEEGRVREDLQLGSAVSSAGGKTIYSGKPQLKVLTSGRNFHPGWRKLFRYNRYRLRYNLSQLRGSQKESDLLKKAMQLREGAGKETR